MKAWSQIAVVGAGAVGCYFGAMLARAGNKVTLIGRQNHVDAVTRHGLLFRSRGAEERVRIAAMTDIAGVGGASLVLFCVKSLDTEDAAREMATHLAPDAVILSLQNGVDNVERIGLHVKNKAMIAALFTAAGVPVKVSENIDVELWTKLVMNCAYNAICALSGAPYGRMVAMPEVADVMRDIVSEVAAVAKAKGVQLPVDIADAAIRLADVMPRTMSSTAQDIAKGKRTETEHLNGTVVRQGEALGIPTPVNLTLNALMKLLEQPKSGQPG